MGEGQLEDTSLYKARRNGSNVGRQTDLRSRDGSQEGPAKEVGTDTRRLAALAVGKRIVLVLSCVVLFS